MQAADPALAHLITTVEASAKSQFGVGIDQSVPQIVRLAMIRGALEPGLQIARELKPHLNSNRYGSAEPETAAGENNSRGIF